MYFIWVSTQKAHIPYLLVVIICILFVLDWKEVHPFVCLWINIEKKLNLYIDKKKKTHVTSHQTKGNIRRNESLKHPLIMSLIEIWLSINWPMLVSLRSSPNQCVQSLVFESAIFMVYKVPTHKFNFFHSTANTINIV